jgi:orotate phosphoribosyltransferase
MLVQAVEKQYRISDEQYDRLWLAMHNYIDSKCIVRDTDMPGKVPGSRYTWMFYLRNGLFNPEFLINLGQMFIYKMERVDYKLNFQITGLETAATPMVASIPMVAKVMGIDINSFVVRKTRKEYGLLNIIEGLPNNKLTVMVDDLCNSSNSLAQCFHKLGEEDVPVANVAFTIVNKSNEGVHEPTRLQTDMYLPKEIKVVSLFTLDDFELNNPSH